MPIRPIDMQVSIPKLSEVSKVHHLENNRASLQQSQGGVASEKENTKEQKTVMHSNKDEKSGNDTDPRRKGRNTYTNKKNQKKEGDNITQDEGPESHHKIDVRI